MSATSQNSTNKASMPKSYFVNFFTNTRMITALTTILFVLMLSNNLTAQNFWEPSGNRNPKCLDDIMSGKNTNCSVSSVLNETLNINNYLNCNVNVTINYCYQIITCNGQSIIQIGAYCVTFKSFLPGWDKQHFIDQSSYDAGLPDLYNDIISKKGLKVDASHKILLANTASCYSHAVVKVYPEDCYLPVDVGTSPHYKSDVTVKDLYFPCTGNGLCCIAICDIDIDGHITKSVVSYDGAPDCGVPNIKDKYVLGTITTCPNTKYEFLLIQDCQFKLCSSFNLDGVYSREYFYEKSILKTNNSSNYITLSPVPVEDYLKIKYNGKPLKTEIINILGEVILKPDINSEIIDLSKLVKGEYIVKVTFEREIKTSKIIKLDK